MQGSHSNEGFKFVYESERKNNEIEETFNASVGCCDRFKNLVQLHNFKFTGKVHSVNEDATFILYILMFKKIIEDGRYTDKQIFSVNETGLFPEQNCGKIITSDMI